MKINLKIQLLKVFIIVTLNAICVSGFSQNLNYYFSKEKLKGSISLYDLKNKKWKHSDLGKAKQGTLPASTFKIIHTLIGLEENVIQGKNDTLKWDGKTKFFKNIRIPNWNKDNDLEMAFKNSTVWYFEEIAKKIKKKRYCLYLKKCEYSNRKINKPQGYDFWNFGKLKVSPIEQIELLIKLYHNELPFKTKYQELTKELMIVEEHSNYTLRGKTGWCYDNLDIGWFVGYFELEDNVIFFATRIKKDLSEQLNGFSKLRKTITKQIASELYDIKI